MPSPSASEPKTVSVILPTLQEEKTIHTALEALHRQTVLPLEVIVVDNGSTDKTKEIVEQFIQTTPAPKTLLLIETRRGPSAARNMGIRQARGEILAFLDADSVPRGDWIERIVALLTPPLAGVGGPCVGFLPGRFMERYFTAVQKVNYTARGLSQEEDLRMNFLPGGNCAFRKDTLLEAGGFDASLSISEDMELCQRLLALGKRLYFDPLLTVDHASNRSIASRLNRNFLAGTVQAKVLKHHFPKGVTFYFGGSTKPRRCFRNAPFAAAVDLFSVTKVLLFLSLMEKGIPVLWLFIWVVLVGWRIDSVYRKAGMRYSFLEIFSVLTFWFVERIFLDFGRWVGSLRTRTFYL